MARLIKADDLKVEIANYFLSCVDKGKIVIDITEMQVELYKIINSQPTAYNVEKVVEGLEEIKGQGCVGVKCKDCKYTHNCFEGERAENVVIDKAIEIIRRGGVE